MKSILKFSLCLFLLGFLNLNLRAQIKTIDNVRLAIKNGNANSLTTYMSSSIDLRIATDEGVYSKKQAGIVLKKFFTKEPASDFKNNHVGSTQSNSKYYSIGTYTSGDKSYRVLISYKLIDGNYLINKIHFDLE
jgi:hypothetical protein